MTDSTILPALLDYKSNQQLILLDGYQPLYQTVDDQWLERVMRILWPIYFLIDCLLTWGGICLCVVNCDKCKKPLRMYHLWLTKPGKERYRSPFQVGICQKCGYVRPTIRGHSGLFEP